MRKNQNSPNNVKNRSSKPVDHNPASREEQVEPAKKKRITKTVHNVMVYYKDANNRIRIINHQKVSSEASIEAAKENGKTFSE